MSTSTENRIAEVLVDLHIDKPLDYAISDEMIGKVKVGSHVEVPIRGKLVLGFVCALKSQSAFGDPKPIARIAESEVTPDLFELAKWMSGYYLTPLKKILKMFIPGSVRKEKAAKTQFFVTRLKTLEETADLARELREKGSIQVQILDVMLQAKKGMLLTELLEKSGCSRSPLESLVKKEILKIDLMQIDRSPLTNQEYFKTKPKKLNPEQKESLDKIVESLAQKTFKVHLLWGITGSGKTEVYLQAIDYALKAGQGAILLVPEISLTEQTIERFRSRFEGHIAILHHRLSEGERLDEWRRVQKGDAQIVIGARSCIFCPIKNLGLIIIDEEHEGSYKQSDEQPRYHAREAAIMRAKICGATVVLGSATPSVESYHNAITGKYVLSELGCRADNQNLPKVTILDMKREYEKNGGYTLFSSPLLDAIKERVKLGEQTILFLNKRGYHTCLKCEGCGEAVKCRHCDVTMTFHKGEKQLACHLCGFAHTPPPLCPSCKTGSPMKFKGVGTEQAEASLKAIFPEIRTLRMDADTTKHKGSHSKLFRDFGRGKADVLIGTQMIAKGLHFPEVTLVGVLSCDTSLNIPDFRSAETAFQLLTQVAGRAGRGGRPGEVIFQTMIPENPTILHAAKQDFKSFFLEEMESRKMFNYPPFAQMVKISASSLSERKAYDMLETLRKKLSQLLPANFEIMMTSPSGHAKVKDHYKFHFLVRGPQISPMIKALTPLLPVLRELKEVKISLDVNPISTFF